MVTMCECVCIGLVSHSTTMNQINNSPTRIANVKNGSHTHTRASEDEEKSTATHRDKVSASTPTNTAIAFDHQSTV